MITAVPHPSQDTSNRSMNEANKSRIVADLCSVQNERLPHHVILEEKPVHTTIAYLLASGRTRAEISTAVGMSTPVIGEVVKQPWFKKRLKEITEANGNDMVKAFLEGEVLPSLEVLRTIRDNDDEKGATRVVAANSILDRFMGKPVAHVESKTTLNIHSAADAKDQVQSELEKVDAELRRLGVQSATPRAN